MAPSLLHQAIHSALKTNQLTSDVIRAIDLDGPEFLGKYLETGTPSSKLFVYASVMSDKPVNSKLEWCCKFNDMESLKYLVLRTVKHRELAFQEACKYGRLSSAKWLLTLPGVDPTARNNLAFQTACCNGHTETAKWLLTLPGVDPTAQDNCAFQWVCHNGHIDTAKWLLTLPGVDPTARNNLAFRWACKNDCTETVQWLDTFVLSEFKTC